MSSQTIAIIGASSNRDKYGNKAVRAYKDQGYTVYPVNPNADEIEGLKAYSSITDISGPVETASVYLPPEKAVSVLEGIKAKDVDTVYFNPGTESDEATRKAGELGLNIVEACSIVAVGRRPGEFE